MHQNVPKIYQNSILHKENKFCLKKSVCLWNCDIIVMHEQILNMCHFHLLMMILINAMQVFFLFKVPLW